MYKQPITGEGKRESEFWFKIKTVWLQVKYNPKYNSISKKEFFRNFMDYCEKCGIPWDYTDKKQNKRIPNTKDYDYANKHGCFKKYAWDECFEQYEEDSLTSSERRVLKNRRKRKEPKTNEDWNYIDDIDAELRALMKGQKQGAHNEYRIAKLVETKIMLENNIDERLEINKEEPETTSPTTIPDNPEHEEQTIRDIWTERARKDVIPR